MFVEEMLFEKIFFLLLFLSAYSLFDFFTTVFAVGQSLVV